MHLPGTDRECWKPCRNVVEDTGFRRCRECEDSISSHDSSAVREALVEEGGLRSSTIRYLMEDPDFTVSAAAENLAARAGISSEL